MIKVVKIDNDGYLVHGNDKVINKNEDMPANYTDIQLPKNDFGQLSFYKPKLYNGKWVEGLTQLEIDERNEPIQIVTVDEYILDLDYRLTLKEMGL